MENTKKKTKFFSIHQNILQCFFVVPNVFVTTKENLVVFIAVMKCPNIIQNQVFKTTVFSHETEPKYVKCDIFNLDSFLLVITGVITNN